MKRLFLPALLCIALTGFGHQTDSIPPTNSTTSTIADTPGKRLADSISIIAPYHYEQDSIQRQRDMDRNIDGILRLQRENNAKQKKAAMTRILFGGAMLVLLIVGLTRRRKKVSQG